MQRGFELFPEQASTVAPKVDAVYFYLLGLTAFFTMLIFLLIVFFALYYRRGAVRDRTIKHGKGTMVLEVTWMIIPLVLAMISFVWGAWVYFDIRTPPDETLELQVVGKQWMWKIQHPQGRQEINELHIPVGMPVKLNMISEDVIHSFYIPEFRVKMDVLPEQYSMLWFEATKPGVYHLFCAEYCGTDHANMSGRVIAMSPSDYAEWLSGGDGAAPAANGSELFTRFRCNTCHHDGATARCPPLDELFNSEVPLADGSTAVADEAYLRESILLPNAKLRRGFEPVMPTYDGQLSEQQVFQLVEYVKSLSPPSSEKTAAAANSSPPDQPDTENESNDAPAESNTPNDNG